MQNYCAKPSISHPIIEETLIVFLFILSFFRLEAQPYAHCGSHPREKTENRPEDLSLDGPSYRRQQRPPINILSVLTAASHRDSSFHLTCGKRTEKEEKTMRPRKKKGELIKVDPINTRKRELIA